MDRIYWGVFWVYNEVNSSPITIPEYEFDLNKTTSNGMKDFTWSSYSSDYYSLIGLGKTQSNPDLQINIPP